jgi:hypothetical protein
MFIFLTILFSIVGYIVGAGATHGYGKHRWPSQYVSSSGMDDNDRRITAACLWPFYWVFIWPFTKVNEVTFSNIEKHAALEIARKKSRIEDLKATRAELIAAQEELEKAEVEVEKEVHKL